MEKKWNITLSKVGSMCISAETEEEAIKIANIDCNKRISWEDSWNVVDIQEIK